MRGEIDAAAGARAAAPDRARRPARRPAHAHHRDRRPGRHRGRWREAARRRGARVHRDHRSQPVAGDGQRPRRAARARARGAHPRGRRRRARRPAAGRHRVRHHAGRLARSRRRLPRRARHRRRLGALGVQPGAAADDRPRAARDREPARRHPRPPDRPAAPQARRPIRSTWRRSSTPRGAPASALEINSQAHRLDLNDVHARLARDRGVPIVISSDAHSRHGIRRTCAGASPSRAAPGSRPPTCSTRDRSTTSVRRLRRHRRPRS